MLGPINQQQVANEKIARMLDATRKTADGMAAQSITGTISWPLYSDAGGIIDTVDIVFGSVRTEPKVSADWTNRRRIPASEVRQPGIPGPDCPGTVLQ